MRFFDWAAPAKLFFWPAADGWDEEAVYPTLHAALSAAGEGDLATAWIVTRDGDIISPLLVKALREEAAATARTRRPAMSLLGWKRAA